MIDQLLAGMVAVHGREQTWEAGLQTLGYPISWATGRPEVLRVKCKLESSLSSLSGLESTSRKE